MTTVIIFNHRVVHRTRESSRLRDRPRRDVRVCLVGSVAAALASCGGGPNTAEPVDVEPFPGPVGAVVLTIAGDVARPNVGDRVEVDLAGIEQLGTVTVEVFEPFLNREMEMSGVPVSTLLGAAGVDMDADLVWTALDDYQVTFNGAAAAREGAIVATRVDGSPIAIAEGGPIRIVFPDPDGRLGRDSNQWIWSIEHVSVS